MTAFCLLLVLLGGIFTGCAPEKARVAFDRLHLTKRLKLQFAMQFQVDYYEGGYKLISLKDGSRFLTVPEMAPTGHLRAQAVQPRHLVGSMVGFANALHCPVGQVLSRT